MVTVARTVKAQGERLVRGADGELYALCGDTCKRIEQGSDTVRTSTYISAETLGQVNMGDHASARFAIEPGDHASARFAIEPGDHTSV